MFLSLPTDRVQTAMNRYGWTLSRHLALVAVVIAFMGCATSGQSSSSGNDPSVISQKEIQEVGEVSSAYNLVRRLQPQWLQKRGRNSLQNPGDILVYVEGNRQGGPGALRQINVVNVKSLEFLRPDEATMRFGSGHDNGAILVHMKGG